MDCEEIDAKGQVFRRKHAARYRVYFGKKTLGWKNGNVPTFPQPLSKNFPYLSVMYTFGSTIENTDPNMMSAPAGSEK